MPRAMDVWMEMKQAHTRIGTISTCSVRTSDHPFVSRCECQRVMDCVVGVDECRDVDDSDKREFWR